MAWRSRSSRLRHPTDKRTHPVHDEINASVTYLPEYLYQEPRRVFAAWLKARRLPGYGQAFRTWIRDLRRDRTPNRIRRFGQACVVAAEVAPRVVICMRISYTRQPRSRVTPPS